MHHIGTGKIRDILPQLDATRLAAEIYRKAGVFVVRKALPPAQIAIWQEAWNEFYSRRLAAGRKVNPFNPVHVEEDSPPALAAIHRCDSLLDIMEQIYPDLAFYAQRFVIKDTHSRAPVFLHQDFGYDYGLPEKTAVFIPLSPVSADNGAMIFYPGTHQCGYLGDAGEIDVSILEPGWPTFCPTLEPGDIVLMHNCTWHASLPHKQGLDRILAHVTYQPANDPSSRALLRGQWRTDLRLGDIPREKFFKRHRVGRLTEMQAEIDRLKDGKRA